jgi:HK97 family phage major capsid protein
VEKELKELTEEVSRKMVEFEKANTAIKLLIEGKVDATKLDALQKAQDKVVADTDKLNKEIEKMCLKMKYQESKFETLEDCVNKAFTPQRALALKERGKSDQFTIDINPISVFKADMTALTNLTYGTTGAISSVPLPFASPGVAKAPDRVVSVLDMVPIGQLGLNQPRLTWVERSARTAGAAARAEGGVMGNSDFTYIRRMTDVINISTYVKTTNESLEYWDQLLSEIRMELVPMLQRQLDDYLIDGQAAQTPAQIVGLANLVNAFTYTGLDDFVPDPTTGDAVFAAVTQVLVNKYNPNGILMHPTDVAKMWLAKDKDANSQKNIVVDLGGNILVGGIPVKINTGIDAGYVLVGDFTKVSVWFRKGIDIRIWDQNEDDPIYGNKTITADMSCAFKVPTVNYDAFVYDQISDIIALIAK